MKDKFFVLRCSAVAALGGLLFGFDTAVISGTTSTLKALWGLSDFWLGFTVASALIGTIIGSIAVGRPSDIFGRRNVLIVMATMYFVSAAGCGIAWDWYSLLVFRFIGGLAVGGASVVSPLYIAEISPAKNRGFLVALAQLTIVVGILCAYISNYIIGTMNLGSLEWRWMFGVEAFPALLFFVLLFTIPFSPRWLMSKKREDEARVVLAKIEPDEKLVEKEVFAIKESLDLEHHRMREPFFTPAYFKPIMLAVAIAFFNQLSGINAVIYFTSDIFKMTGADKVGALGQSMIIGLTNLVFTIAAMAIIDKFGRKKLMLVGSIGYIVSLATASWAFFTFGGNFTDGSGIIVLVAIMVFIASHAFGQGACIWVFIGEVFPNRVRARGQAIGTFTHWVFAAVISWTFPMIAGQFGGGGIFAFYAFMMVLQLLWVIFVMPETKGVPLEEIQKKMGIE